MLVQDFAEGGLVGIGSADQSEIESAGSESERTHAEHSKLRESVTVFENENDEKSKSRSSPVVNTSRTETTLNDFESFAPSQDQVLLGYTNILVDNFVVTLGCVVESELDSIDGSTTFPAQMESEKDAKMESEKDAKTYDLHRSHELDTGSVTGNNDDGLLVVLASRGVTESGNKGNSRYSNVFAKKVIRKGTYDFPRTR